MSVYVCISSRRCVAEMIVACKDTVHRHHRRRVVVINCKTFIMHSYKKLRTPVYCRVNFKSSIKQTRFQMSSERSRMDGRGLYGLFEWTLLMSAVASTTARSTFLHPKRIFRTGIAAGCHRDLLLGREFELRSYAPVVVCQ